MSLTKVDLDAVKALVEDCESFVIASHERPDPDALGSSLALARGLARLGKDVTVLSSDGGVPDSCKWLPDSESVIAETARRGFDAGIICDADGLGRIGKAAEVLKSAKNLVIIDHHPGNHDPGPGFSSVALLVDTTAAATAEIIYALLHHVEAVIDDSAAMQLMAGIVGDTGGFRFPNVTPLTLEIASRLTAMGVSPATAAREIYENRALANAKLLGAALLSMQVSDGGRIVAARITRADFEQFDGDDADTDGIVNQIMAIKGAEAAVLIREVKPNEQRISLRSRGRVDVNRVAGAFGGGGHAAAAGCTVEGTLQEAERAVLAEVRACMES
jgi:bifunctional oligoribonuclease and PAP phosphatase NrnA